VALFCDTGLAERIERAEAQLISACSHATSRRTASPIGFVMPIAGGLACFAEKNSPFNKVVGMGFGGLPGAAGLDEIEDAYAACGSPVQIELAHLADQEIGAFVTGRGYRLVSFENVLGRGLDGDRRPTTVTGVEVRPSDDDEFERWLDVIVDASLHPDTQGVPWHEEFPRHILEDAERDAAAAGVTRYTALLDGVIAGGASVRMADGIAQLTGAATAPAHRRKGIQTALTAARLADAAAAGCDIAVVTTQPGSKSQQNVQRQGFELLYTRAVLVKDPGGTPTGG
jgi:GNAT superfamily N-acetyltransferase